MQRWPGLLPPYFLSFFWAISHSSRRANAGFDLFDDELINDQRPNGKLTASDFIIDIREYDVPYHVRVSIDKGWLLIPSLREFGLTLLRYTYWEMVRRGGKAWPYHIVLHGREIAACRSSRPCF
jgi:hypothetical protein